MENATYYVEIEESSRELTLKERVALKQAGGANKLDEMTANGDVLIAPVGYVVLKIHNEKSADKDYKQYVVFDKSGERYVTGSNSFFTSFLDIFRELNGENGEMLEDYQLRVFRKPSKNYAGKSFLSCDVI